VHHPNANSCPLPCFPSTHFPAHKPHPTSQPLPPPQANIHRTSTPEDWRLRDAATLAFGCIMEGPNVAKVLDIVRSGLPFLLQALNDSSPAVKNTTAWTIG
jgi:hypothetical protein